jgi:hypothetical protein
VPVFSYVYLRHVLTLLFHCLCCDGRKHRVKRSIKVPAISNKLADIPPDDYSWRKYGQKPIKGSPHPRYARLFHFSNMVLVQAIHTSSLWTELWFSNFFYFLLIELMLLLICWHSLCTCLLSVHVWSKYMFPMQIKQCDAY